MQRGAPYTADTRLSAFGAWTPGLLIAKQLDGGGTIDLKVEYYEQRGAWRLGGGSEGLLPFSARWIQVCIAKTL